MHRNNGIAQCGKQPASATKRNQQALYIVSETEVNALQLLVDLTSASQRIANDPSSVVSRPARRARLPASSPESDRVLPVLRRNADTIYSDRYYLSAQTTIKAMKCLHTSDAQVFSSPEPSFRQTNIKSSLGACRSRVISSEIRVLGEVVSA